MKTAILCGALAVISLFSAASLLDQFDLKGEKRKCIQSYDIDQTQVIDENNVLFRVHVNKYYVNRLFAPVPSSAATALQIYATRHQRAL